METRLSGEADEASTSKTSGEHMFDHVSFRTAIASESSRLKMEEPVVKCPMVESDDFYSKRLKSKITNSRLKSLRSSPTPEALDAIQVNLPLSSKSQQRRMPIKPVRTREKMPLEHKERDILVKKSNQENQEALSIKSEMSASSSKVEVDRKVSRGKSPPFRLNSPDLLVESGSPNLLENDEGLSTKEDEIGPSATTVKVINISDDEESLDEALNYILESDGSKSDMPLIQNVKKFSKFKEIYDKSVENSTSAATSSSSSEIFSESDNTIPTIDVSTKMSLEVKKSRIVRDMAANEFGNFVNDEGLSTKKHEIDPSATTIKVIHLWDDEESLDEALNCIPESDGSKNDMSSIQNAKEFCKFKETHDKSAENSTSSTSSSSSEIFNESDNTIPTIDAPTKMPLDVMKKSRDVRNMAANEFGKFELAINCNKSQPNCAVRSLATSSMQNSSTIQSTRDPECVQFINPFSTLLDFTDTSNVINEINGHATKKNDDISINSSLSSEEEYSKSLSKIADDVQNPFMNNMMQNSAELKDLLNNCNKAYGITLTDNNNEYDSTSCSTCRLSPVHTIADLKEHLSDDQIGTGKYFNQNDLKLELNKSGEKSKCKFKDEKENVNTRFERPIEEHSIQNFSNLNVEHEIPVDTFDLKANREGILGKVELSRKDNLKWIDRASSIDLLDPFSSSIFESSITSPLILPGSDCFVGAEKYVETRQKCIKPGNITKEISRKGNTELSAEIGNKCSESEKSLNDYERILSNIQFTEKISERIFDDSEHEKSCIRLSDMIRENFSRCLEKREGLSNNLKCSESEKSLNDYERIVSNIQFPEKISERIFDDSEHEKSCIRSSDMIRENFSRCSEKRKGLSNNLRSEECTDDSGNVESNFGLSQVISEEISGNTECVRFNIGLSGEIKNQLSDDSKSAKSNLGRRRKKFVRNARSYPTFTLRPRNRKSSMANSNHLGTSKRGLTMTPHHVLTRLCQQIRQNMAKKGLKDNEIEWNVDSEVLFLLAMDGLKPVGVNRHFMMLLIHHRFSSYLDHQVSSKVLWDHLDTLYNMAALHESEIIPFPNEEVDFELPEDCYDLAKSKFGALFKQPNNKSSSNKKVSSKMATPKLKHGNIPGSSKTLSATTSLNKHIKSETKTSANNGMLEIMQESTPSVKINRMKLSPSSFCNKIIRSESFSSKESSPDILCINKNKEKSNTPATKKKHNKSESSLVSSTSKKYSKYEAQSFASKSVKKSTPVSMKKVKSEKDVSRKGKTLDNAPGENKSSKVEYGDDVRKKESVAKAIETCMKSDIKISVSSSKVNASSGSRKSSVVKAKSSDNSKIVKHPKQGEHSKKTTSGSKRRKIA